MQASPGTSSLGPAVQGEVFSAVNGVGGVKCYSGAAFWQKTVRHIYSKLSSLVSAKPDNQPQSITHPVF